LFTRLEHDTGRTHLWLLAPGEKPVRLTPAESSVQAFAYSPLHGILVYQEAVSEYGEDFSLFGLKRKALPDGEPVTFFAPPPGRSDHNPVFSPKGDHLAFNRLNFEQRDEPGYDDGLFIAHYEKGIGAPVKINKINSLKDYVHIPICFSPDSRYLAIQRAPLAEFATGDSLIIDVEKGTLLHVIKDTWAEGWSPDGKSILLTAMRKDEPGIGIFIAEVGRQERRPITVSGFSDEDPRWSPDGKSILCHSRTIDGVSLGIWKINVETGDRVLLTERGSYARWARGGSGFYLLRTPDEERLSPDIYWMDAKSKFLKKVVENTGDFVLIPWKK
ncbi:MAG: hypothetical protein ABIH66_01590, partial [bacterium]